MKDNFIIDIESEKPAQPRTYLSDINELIETVDAVPTHVPKTVYDQIKIYINGATFRLYIYDVTNNTWRYSTLT